MSCSKLKAAAFGMTLFLHSVAVAATPVLPDNATIDAQILAQDLALRLAPIHSRAELRRYSFETPPPFNPLSRLSPLAQKRFTDSLVFRGGRLVSFSYDDLEAELAVSQIHAILSLFGVQHVTGLINHARIDTNVDRLIMSQPMPLRAVDQKEKKCAAENRCESSSHDICMAGC